MTKRYFCTSIELIVFKKLILQAANTDLLNQSIPKAHNSEIQNVLVVIPLQFKPVKVS